jgi:hypothetical protein
MMVTVKRLKYVEVAESHTTSFQCTASPEGPGHRHLKLDTVGATGKL